MTNVRLYQEMVLLYFSIKHGQFAAVALRRSSANKMLRQIGKYSFFKEIDLFLVNITTFSTINSKV